MLSQEIDINIKMGVSKPIDIPIVSNSERMKKSGSFCINIDEEDKIDESINEYIYDHINMPNNNHEYFDIDYKTVNKNNNRRNDKNDTNIMTTNNKDNKDKYYNNYSLDTICFDPTKFSPPDEWSLRLKHRIRNYEANDSTLYLDYLFDNK